MKYYALLKYSALIGAGVFGIYHDAPWAAAVAFLMAGVYASVYAMMHAEVAQAAIEAEVAEMRYANR